MKPPGFILSPAALCCNYCYRQFTGGLKFFLNFWEKFSAGAERDYKNSPIGKPMGEEMKER